MRREGPEQGVGTRKPGAGRDEDEDRPGPPRLGPRGRALRPEPATESDAMKVTDGPGESEHKLHKRALSTRRDSHGAKTGANRVHSLTQFL